LTIGLFAFTFPGLSQDAPLPEGPGKETMERVCGMCHAANFSLDKGNTHDGWTQTVSEMVARGAQGSDEEFATVVDYLTKNYPPKAEQKKVNVNKAEASELQTGLKLAEKDAAAIVAYRKQNGDFKDLAGLKKVPGIDATKLDSIKDQIAF
jgi:competence protein ComEA